MTEPAISWQPPGGGSWELETLHLRGPQPRLYQPLVAEAFALGSRDLAERYGFPISMEARFVNDHCYVRVRAVGEPEPKPGKDPRPPPPLLIKLLSRVHPALRRCNRIAHAALSSRRWLVERGEWLRHWRGEQLAANRALQAEAVDRLTDGELLDHLDRVADHVGRSARLHLRLTPVHDVPVGRLLLACRRWGIPDGAALALLAGSSPASVASSTGLRRIAAACADAGVTPTTVDDVRAASADAAAALDEYLADHGWRAVTQYSPVGLTLGELPNILLQAIACAGSAPVDGDDQASIDTVRSRVPVEQRSHFDELLDDARQCYGTRDDNVALTFLWPVGLLRRAMLELGRRLVERDVVDETLQVMALERHEMTAALGGDAAVGGVARDRAKRMAAAQAAGAPLQLGPSAGEPPDPSVLPKAMAEMTSAVSVMFELEGFGSVPTTRWTGEGVGLGPSAYTGRACVATTPEDALERLVAGDVLVTGHTTPAYEVVLPVAGAVVTEVGGLISHAALVARELGLPAVLGVANATTMIPNGATVRVDPVANVVVIAAPAPD